MPDPVARLPGWLALAVFALALSAAAWRVPAPPPAERVPAQPVQLAPEELPPAARFSPQRASLSRLADGRLAAAWLEEGDGESAAIRLAIRDGKGWHELGKIASRESTAAATFMHARRLGRPILLAEGGWLHLWYEAYPLGDAAGASIIHSVSTDGGRNWKGTRRLETQPFGGLGAYLGEIPRPLADGGLLLPLARSGTDGPWLRLAATGQIVDKLGRLPPPMPAGGAAR